ncbi:MAG: ribosome maturation factor RimM [Acidobacteriota bacterium]
MDELVVIARIVKTRGLRGEVVADMLTDFPERFEGLDDVIVRSVASGDQRELKIEKFWFQKGRVILKFAGLDTIEAAETLRDTDVCVPEADAVELEDDEFFDWQLAGCKVESIDGTPIGEVAEVMRTGGTEILVVKGDEKEYLIPFAESICTEVDIENKLIRIDPPEGLLEF